MPKVQPPELKGFMDKRLSGEKRASPPFETASWSIID